MVNYENVSLQTNWVGVQAGGLYNLTTLDCTPYGSTFASLGFVLKRGPPIWRRPGAFRSPIGCSRLIKGAPPTGRGDLKWIFVSLSLW